ncbi:MAG: type I-C CRISPR-associated protein Cas7/Csd2 [Oscillospiraceae bacterium]
MSEFKNKIDFAVILTVTNANPNGDPLNGNRPRENFDGFGEISDVCIKRKIRNRLQDLGGDIFVQSDERNADGYQSLKERADKCSELKAAGTDKNAYAKAACEKWIDVRSFGQVFAFKKDSDKKKDVEDKKKDVEDEKKDKGVSVGVRGPVSIQSAFSVSPVDITTIQITKSVNGDPTTDGRKSSDTMGAKHRVDFGVYKFFGSISHQLSEKTGFSKEDSEKIKEALCSLFENDSSSARPDGSMEVYKVYWWEHDSFMGKQSSAKVHRSLKIEPKDKNSSPKSIDDYDISVAPLDGVKLEEYNGI